MGAVVEFDAPVGMVLEQALLVLIIVIIIVVITGQDSGFLVQGGGNKRVWMKGNRHGRNEECAIVNRGPKIHQPSIPKDFSFASDQ